MYKNGQLLICREPEFLEYNYSAASPLPGLLFQNADQATEADLQINNYLRVLASISYQTRGTVGDLGSGVIE